MKREFKIGDSVAIAIEGTSEQKWDGATRVGSGIIVAVGTSFIRLQYNCNQNATEDICFNSRRVHITKYDSNITK